MIDIGVGVASRSGFSLVSIGRIGTTSFASTSGYSTILK